MRKESSTTINHLYKLILVLTVSLCSEKLIVGSQRDGSQNNNTRQSQVVTLQGSSCDLASIPLQQAAVIKESNNETVRGEDLDDSAATASIVQMTPTGQQLIKNEDQQTSPSVTSVHQVWTSSSSGSIGELSPEIISKLRNDVPFLAAYALRPRLVGVSSTDKTSGSDQKLQHLAGSQPVESYVSQLQAPSSAERSTTATVSQPTSKFLQVQASSPAASKSLLPKLGDFSEFNVETSSTSKSEHTHKRKTSLKRKPKESGELSSKRRTILDTANQLIKRRRRDNHKKGLNKSFVNKSAGRRKRSRLSKTSNRKSTAKRSGAVLKSQLRANKLRGKMNRGNLNHHMNIIKHGRYYQEKSIKPGDDETSDMTINSKSIGDQTTTMVLRAGTKGDEGVKGGSSGDRKTPFYSRIKPTVGTNESDGSNESIGGVETDNDQPRDDSRVNSVDRTRNNGESPSSSGIDTDTEEPGLLEEPLEPPMRVGDDDVEEEGDTVTVMPKSDGVDDDPEIPLSGPEEDQNIPAEDQGDTREREGGGNDIPETDEPRTSRVDRERPNQDSGSTDPNSQGEHEGRHDQGSAAGAGIGATTGGSGGTSNGDGSADSRGDAEDVPGSGEFGSRGSSSGTAEDGDNRSSVDEEPDERSRSGGSGGNSSSGEDGGLSADKGSATPEEEAGGEFDSHRSGTRDQNNGRKETKQAEDEAIDEGADVDYRDEMAEAAGRKKQARNGTETSTDEEEKTISTRRKKTEDCEDHHKEGHYDHHDHHDHHDSIKWLEGAISGQPGEDYPILSRVNVSNFNCRDQKYPGFYADLESRCQVSSRAII